MRATFLLTVLAAAGCAVARPVAQRAAPMPGAASVSLPAGLPRLLVEEPTESVGRGTLHGPVQPDPGMAWTKLVRDSLPQELSRLGWPLAQSRALSGARMKASVVGASAKWSGGFGVRVDGEVKLLIVLKDPDGREVWETALTGSGVGRAGAGGVPVNGIRSAWNAALADAMARLGPLLDAKKPWLLLGAQAPSAPAPSVAAPSPPRSDLDELPAQARTRKAHAVVIGIENYRESLPAADFAARDARLAARYFRRVLGVPEANIALLTDAHATRGDFEKYFERWLPNRVEPGDEVYVYFSGHGAPNPAGGEAYLVPYDGDPTYIEQTGYGSTANWPSCRPRASSSRWTPASREPGDAPSSPRARGPWSPSSPPMSRPGSRCSPPPRRTRSAAATRRRATACSPTSCSRA